MPILPAMATGPRLPAREAMRPTPPMSKPVPSAAPAAHPAALEIPSTATIRGQPGTDAAVAAAATATDAAATIAKAMATMAGAATITQTTTTTRTVITAITVTGIKHSRTTGHAAVTKGA